MSCDARIAVGLRALHCALAAKDNRLCESHRVKLLRDVLVHSRDDNWFCDAVLSFVSLSYSQQVLAGQGLLDFLSSTGTEMKTTAAEVEKAFETIEAEIPAKYQWQLRRDING